MSKTVCGLLTSVLIFSCGEWKVRCEVKGAGVKSSVFATRSRSDGSRVLHSLLAGVFAGSCAASFSLPPVFAIQSVIQCRAVSYIMSARTKAIQTVADALLIRGQSVLFLTVSGPLPLSLTYFRKLVRHINMPCQISYFSNQGFALTQFWSAFVHVFCRYILTSALTTYWLLLSGCWCQYVFAFVSEGEFAR
jgi:hypothetical protein